MATTASTGDAPKIAVSVDLDGVGCYYRIHGLGEPPPPPHRHAILRKCLPRFLELFARHGIQATFFVVGADLADDAAGRGLLVEAARAGHELANHTHTHPYDFTRLPRTTAAAEIDRAHAAIADVAGQAPIGFRAPGYAINGQVLELLGERGYAYDSSVFPSPPYYAAKAAVMAAMRLFGRRSASVLDDARAPFAPREPYRPTPAAPYRRAPGGAGLVEIPIAVTPFARLHVIGTSLILAPGWLRRRMIAASLKRPLFNLELHGIDLADAGEDAIPAALVARQPDLRRPLAHKRRVFEDLFTEARAARFQSVPLGRALAI
ncbi:MAG TPA: polysaccharide deacetylase family protein [Polyangia bacterium]|nr:polysaccharide deacetylase family protein [Polyangia bacterium]